MTALTKDYCIVLFLPLHICLVEVCDDHHGLRNVFAVDIISAIEFDKTGDHLATGDRGGRVVLFERTDTKDVSISVLVVSVT